MRNQPACIADGHIYGGYNSVYELICPDCGDDPDLDYLEVAPRLRWLRGPYTLTGALVAYHRHQGIPWAEEGAAESGPGGVWPGKGRREPVITVRKITPRLTAVMPRADRHLRRLPRHSLARLAASPSAAGLCRVQPARARRAAGAWNGGKPHRAFAGTPAQPGGG
jgi:hypothetical protein